MRDRFRLFFRIPRNNAVLIELRERLLKVMLYSSFILGTLLLVIAVIPAMGKAAYPTILFYFIVYIWISLIAFLPRLPYRTRAIGWLGIFYALGTLNLFESGFNVDSGLFLITFIGMAILLMDLPGGLVALVLGAVTISVFGHVNTNLNFHLIMGLHQSDPMLWIIGGIVFIMMGVLLIYSLTIVVHGLEDNLANTTRLAQALEHSNKALMVSEASYRILVETSPDLVLKLDLEGNVSISNQAGLSLFGYEQITDVAGKNLVDFVVPEERERASAAFEKVIQTGGIKDFGCRMTRKDGSIFFAEFNAALLANESGAPQAVITIGRDITARLEAEQQKQTAADETLRRSEARYQSLYESMMDPFVQVDLNGRIEQFNQSYQNMLGYDPDELRSRTYMDLTPERWHAFEAELTQEQIWVRGFTDIYEKEYIRKDGTVFPVELRSALMRDLAGNPIAMWALVRDISERKKNEQALRISEIRYRSLYESMMDAYVRTDLQGRILEFNQVYQKMAGFEADELRKLTYQDLTPKKWHAREAEITEKQVLVRGYSDVYEKEYIRKDGTTFPVELRAVLLRDEAGNPAGTWALIRDISERKKTEEALRESEARYRGLVDNSMQWVIVFQGLRIVYVNQATSDALGYTVRELQAAMPEQISKWIHPDDRRLFWEKMQARMEGDQLAERFTMRVIHKNGECRWIEARNIPILMDNSPALLITAIDVTDIRRVEAELRESERTQRSIVNAYDAVVFLADANGLIISANDKFSQRLGIPPERVGGTYIHGIFPEEVTRERRLKFNQVVSSGQAVIFEDTRNGIWFENSFYPIQDESGKVVRVAAFILDITEKKNMVDALSASEAKYRSLAETAHDMIYIIDREDRIEYINSFGAAFLGHSPKKMIGQARAFYFPEQTSQHQQASLRNVMQTGEASYAENAIVFPDRTIWLSTSLVPLRNGEGKITSVLGVSRDITDQKRGEEELRQARDLLEARVAERTAELMDSQEKMRLLTKQTIRDQEEERRILARELHDDAGQALVTLQYSLSAVQASLPPEDTFSSERLADSLHIIDQTIQHIRSMAHNLRPPVLDIGGIDLSLKEYCREQAERTRIPILYQGKDIPGLPSEISISLYRFVQEAITNVLKHAKASQVKVRLQHKKGEIFITVIDNGQGIADAHQTSGMGLEGIRERLQLLGGRLEVYSSKGRGTKLVALVPWRRPRRRSSL